MKRPSPAPSSRRRPRRRVIFGLVARLPGALRRQQTAGPEPAPEVSAVRALAFRLEAPIEQLRQQERQRFIAGEVSYDDWSACEGALLAARAEVDGAEGDWSAAEAQVQRLEHDYHAGVITWGQLDHGIDRVRDELLAAWLKRANLPGALERMQARSDPVNPLSSSHPAVVTPVQGRPVPGARVSPRVTDPRIIVFLVLAVVCAGLAFVILAPALPYMNLALTGATTTGVVQQVHYCARNSYQPTIAFFDTQGREHFGTDSCRSYTGLHFAVNIRYSPADPDGGIVIDSGPSDRGAFWVLFGALVGLAGLFCLGCLLFRIRRVGVVRLSHATWLTALLLVVLLSGLLGVVHLAPQNQTPYRHYHVGETATALGVWTITVKSARTVPLGGSGAIDSGVRCLVFDVVVRNISSHIQSAVGMFTMYALTGQQFDTITSQRSDDPNGLQLDSLTELGNVTKLPECPLTGPDLRGNLAPGDMREGQVAFGLGQSPNVHLFWLAFEAWDYSGDETETTWDIPGSAVG